MIYLLCSEQYISFGEREHFNHCMMAEGQHIVGSEEPFDVDSGDWPAYTERLESYFIANDINDGKKQVAILLILVGTRAYNLL